MANGIKVYANWCEAIHSLGEESPMKAKELAFRIIDYGYTGVMDLEGLSALDKDWLVTVSRGIDETNQKAKGEKPQGRPKLEIDDKVQELLDQGVTVGTQIAKILNVSKDTVYATQPWLDHQAAKKAAKEKQAGNNVSVQPSQKMTFNF